MDIELIDTATEVKKSAGAQRTGVLITLISVVGAVAIMDIVAEMIVNLVRLREGA